MKRIFYLGINFFQMLIFTVAITWNALIEPYITQKFQKAEAKIIPKVMAYDIEVLPPEIGVPNPKNDQIIIISLVCNDGYKKIVGGERWNRYNRTRIFRK